MLLMEKNMAQRRIESLVYFDLESTGLECSHKITELSMISVQRDHFEDSAYSKPPRVQNKLSLCVYPKRLVLPSACEITGLHNENLYDQQPFDETTFFLINSFLERLKPPICLLAHNGNIFDFPLLRSEINKAKCSLSSNILCCDTLMFFRVITEQNTEEEIVLALNNTKSNAERDSQTAVEKSENTDTVMDTGTPTHGKDAKTMKVQSSVRRRLFEDPLSNMFKPNACNNILSLQRKTKKYQSCSLPELYKLFYGEVSEYCHRAEDDCLALLKICHFKRKEFCEWIDKYAESFNNIPLAWA